MDTDTTNTPSPDPQTQNGTTAPGDNQQPSDTPSPSGSDPQNTADTDNQPPIARITPPDSFTSGQTVILYGDKSSDPDGDTLSYIWEQTGGDIISDLNNTSSYNLTFTAPEVSQATVFTFQLTVNDGKLSNSASVSVQITPVANNTSPSIVSRSPLPDESGVSTTAEISVGFDKALLETSVNSQSLVLNQGGTQVSGEVSYDSVTKTITNKPASALSPDTTYTVTLADTLEDISGNAIAGESWSFSTAAEMVADGQCATAEEGNSLMLNCPAGQVITEVIFASYGTPGGTCGSFTTGSCNANNSLTVLSDACKGKNSCALYAGSDTFGNPCEGTAKKLAAQVACGMATDTNPDPDQGEIIKPRVINTTDIGGDPDDEQSMVRQLVMSNEYDLEGLIATTGCWRKNISSTSPIDKIVDAYGEALPNLQKHADGFPSYEYLKSITAVGQKGYGMGDVGEGKDSAGSELIIAAVDKDDPRPVWATCWGGCNTIAQAIWKVQNTRSSSELDKFLSKLRVYDVLGQDNAGTWMAKTFPNLIYIRATGVYGWAPSDSWVSKNVQSHGPLGKVYPNRKYAIEGDTPSFMHLNPNGLHNPDMLDQGGWGGRFDPNKKEGIRGMDCMKGEDAKYDPYYMYGNTSEGANAIKQWSNGYNNDFEARMDWSVTSNYSDANHHPVAVVNGSKTREVLEMTTSPGTSIELSAKGSSDPDGNELSYSWSFDEKPSSYKGSVKIQGGSSETATVEIPSNAGGKSIHVILQMHDSGTPNLYAYRRVIISVQSSQ